MTWPWWSEVEAGAGVAEAAAVVAVQVAAAVEAAEEAKVAAAVAAVVAAAAVTVVAAARAVEEWVELQWRTQSSDPSANLTSSSWARVWVVRGRRRPSAVAGSPAGLAAGIAVSASAVVVGSCRQHRPSRTATTWWGECWTWRLGP